MPGRFVPSPALPPASLGTSYSHASPGNFPSDEPGSARNERGHLSPTDRSLPDAFRGVQRTSSDHVSSDKTNEAAEPSPPREKSRGSAEAEGGTAKKEQMAKEAEKEAQKGEDGEEEQSSGERKGPGEVQKKGAVSGKTGEGGIDGGKGGSREGEWCEALAGEVCLVACRRPQLLARSERGRGAVCVNIDDELVCGVSCSGNRAVSERGRGAVCVNINEELVRGACHVALWRCGAWGVGHGGRGGSVVYEPYCMDFGPLSLACIHRYCDTMDRALQVIGGCVAPATWVGCAVLRAVDDSWVPARGALHVEGRGLSRRVVHVCSSAPHKKANAALLLAAYLILRHAMPANAAHAVLRPLEPLPPFRDASNGVCTFHISALDCCQALERAQERALIAGFRVGEYERLEQADLTWMLPGRLLAFSTPADDPASVMEGYLTPEDYVQYFRQAGIAAIIRLNRRVYDKRRFTRHGFAFYDLYFPDGGSVKAGGQSVAPSDGIVRLFAMVEGSKAAQALQGAAVPLPPLPPPSPHQSPLGRHSGALLCCGGGQQRARGHPLQGAVAPFPTPLCIAAFSTHAAWLYCNNPSFCHAFIVRSSSLNHCTALDPITPMRSLSLLPLLLLSLASNHLPKLALLPSSLLPPSPLRCCCSPLPHCAAAAPPFPIALLLLPQAGLGRTGVLVGCYLMKHCGMTAREVRGSGEVRTVGLVGKADEGSFGERAVIGESAGQMSSQHAMPLLLAIAYTRLVRPGSVIGQQQHFLALMHPRMARAHGASSDITSGHLHVQCAPLTLVIAMPTPTGASVPGEEFRCKTRTLSPFSPRTTTTSTAPGNPPPVHPHAHASSLALPSRTGRKVYARTDEQAAAAVADLQFARHSRSLARTGSVPVRPGSVGPVRSGSSVSASLRLPLGRSVSRPGSSSGGAESSMSGGGGGGGEGIGPKRRRQREGGGRERRAASAATTPRAHRGGDGVEGVEEGGGSGEEGEEGGEGGEEAGGVGVRESGAWVRLRRLGGSMRMPFDSFALSLSSSPALRRPISKSASMSPYTPMPPITPMTPHAPMPVSHASSALHRGMASPEPRHVRAARRLRLRGVWGAADGMRIGGNVGKEAGEGGGDAGEVRVAEGRLWCRGLEGGVRCGDGECSAVEDGAAVREAECVGEEGAGAADGMGGGRVGESAGVSASVGASESVGVSVQAEEDPSVLAFASRLDSAAQAAPIETVASGHEGLVAAAAVALEKGGPEAAAMAPDSERAQTSASAAAAAAAAEGMGVGRKTHSRAASWLGLSFCGLLPCQPTRPPPSPSSSLSLSPPTSPGPSLPPTSLAAAGPTGTRTAAVNPHGSPLPVTAAPLQACPPCSAAGAAERRGDAEGAAEEPVVEAVGSAGASAGLSLGDREEHSGTATDQYTPADAAPTPGVAGTHEYTPADADLAPRKVVVPAGQEGRGRGVNVESGLRGVGGHAQAVSVAKFGAVQGGRFRLGVRR
ncbi:unnamed protein product [Closterium sp. NIES-64]|nr:unnamed protein product [Closterium sp. NIES-64]